MRLRLASVVVCVLVVLCGTAQIGTAVPRTCPAPEAFVAVPNKPSPTVLTSNDTIVDYLLATDVNADGLVDIVAVNSFAGFPSVRVFAAQANPQASFVLHSLVSADVASELLSVPIACNLTSDAYPEIVVWLRDELAFARNLAGNLTAPSLVRLAGSATNGAPFSSWNPIVCADVSGDGYADLVTCDTQTNELTVFLNSGTGSTNNGTGFTRLALLNLTDIEWAGVRKWPFGLADVLLDSPGLEIVAAPSLAAGLGIYSLNIAAAVPVTPAAPLDATMFPTQISLVNLDADSGGLLDVLVSMGSPDVTSDTRLLCFFQSADGSFGDRSAVSVADAGAPIFSLAVLDRNADGLVDLVLSTMDFVSDVYAVVALWGTEPGRLGQAVQLQSGTTALFYCASVIAVPSPGAVAPVAAAMNDRSASLRIFAVPPPPPPANLSTTLVSPFALTQRVRSGSTLLVRALALYARDMNSDAVQDVIAVSKLGVLLFVPGLGRGQFSVETQAITDASVEYVREAHAHAAQLVDVNGDGALDILCLTTSMAMQQTRLIGFFAIAAGWARVGESDLIAAGGANVTNPFALSVFDANGDLMLDLAIACAPGVLVALHANNGSGGAGGGGWYKAGVVVLSSPQLTSLLAAPLGWPVPEPCLVATLSNGTVLFLSLQAGLAWQVRGVYNATGRLERALVASGDVVVHLNRRPAPCSGAIDVQPGGDVAGELSNSLNNGRYDINQACLLTWRNFSPNASVLLTVLELRSEQCCDFLTVTSANGTQLAALSGQLAGAVSFVLPANGSTVLWQSDFSITDLGFRLVWRIISTGPGPSPPPPPAPAPPPPGLVSPLEYVSLVRLRYKPDNLVGVEPRTRVSVVSGPFTTGSVEDSLFTDLCASAPTSADLDAIVAVTQFNAYFWLGSSNANCSSSCTSGRRARVEGLSANAAALADFDGDGDVDLLVSDGTGLELVLGPDSLWSPYPRTSRELLDASALLNCGTHLACLLDRVLAGSSACVRDTITLPAGLYTNCYGLRPLRLASRRLTIGAAAGALVLIDCSASTGAAAGAQVLFSVEGGAELTLMDMTIVHARSQGAPLLQVSGAGSVLLLANMTIRNCTSSGDYGGVISARDGASLVLTHTHISLASAWLSGGAVALLGESVRFEARASVFDSCTALQGSGGALYGDGLDLTVSLQDCTFAHNLAIRPGFSSAMGIGGGGGGGAVYLSASAGSFSVTMRRTEFLNNSCGWFGGDIALLSAAASSSSFSSGSRAASGQAGGAGQAGAAGGGSGSLASVLLQDVRSVGARAGLAGGSLGLAVDGGKVVLERVNISFVSSAWAGGALALVSMAKVVPFLRQAEASLASGSQLPDDASLGLGVHVSDYLALSFSTAERYGGAILLCGTSLTAPGDRVHLRNVSAALAGSGMYACVCPALGGCLAAQALARANISQACSAAGMTDSCVAGPPLGVVLAESLPSFRATGLAFGSGAVVLLDAFDQAVLDDRVLVTLVPVGFSTVRVLQGTNLRVFPGALTISLGEAALASTSNSLDDVYELPTTIEFELSNSAILGGRPRLLSTTVQLTRCPARFGLSAGVSGVNVCQACLPGTSSPVESLSACQLLQCPDNALLSFNSTTREGVCLCKAGFFFSTESECSSCPVGGVCAGAPARPVAQPGYYPVPGTDSQFVECERPNACVGGPQLCSDSTTGFMCSNCRASYYSDSTGSCVSCPKRSGSVIGPLALIPVLLIVGATLFIVLSMRIRLRVLRQEREQEARLGHNDLVRSRTLPRSPSMLITYLQIIGILASSNLNWSSRSQRFLSAFEYANVDLTVISTACVGTYWVQWVYMLCIPLVVALWCWCLIWLTSCLAPGSLARADRWRFALRCFFVLGNLAYVPTARNALLFFDCTRLPAPDNSWRLDADMTERCYSSTWFGLLPLALIALVIYVLALPVLGMFWLNKNHDDLRDATTTFWLGSLYGHLRARYWFFEIVHLMKRLAVVITSLYMSRAPILLIGTLGLLFFVSGFLQARLVPYVAHKHNRLEMVLAASATMVLFLGFMSFADRFPNSWSRLLVDVFVILVSGVTLVYALVACCLEIRSYVLAKASGQVELVDSNGLDQFVSEAVREAYYEAVREIGEREAQRAFTTLMNTGNIRVRSSSELRARTRTATTSTGKPAPGHAAHASPEMPPLGPLADSPAMSRSNSIALAEPGVPMQALSPPPDAVHAAAIRETPMREAPVHLSSGSSASESASSV